MTSPSPPLSAHLASSASRLRLLPAISHAHSAAPNRASLAGPHSAPTTAGRTRPSTPLPCATRKSATATAGADGFADAASSAARAMGCVAPRSSVAAMATAVALADAEGDVEDASRECISGLDDAAAEEEASASAPASAASPSSVVSALTSLS